MARLEGDRSTAQRAGVAYRGATARSPDTFAEDVQCADVPGTTDNTLADWLGYLPGLLSNLPGTPVEFYSALPAVEDGTSEATIARVGGNSYKVTNSTVSAVTGVGEQDNQNGVRHIGVRTQDGNLGRWVHNPFSSGAQAVESVYLHPGPNGTVELTVRLNRARYNAAAATPWTAAGATPLTIEVTGDVGGTETVSTITFNDSASSVLSTSDGGREIFFQSYLVGSITDLTTAGLEEVRKFSDIMTSGNPFSMKLWAAASEVSARAFTGLNGLQWTRVYDGLLLDTKDDLETAKGRITALEDEPRLPDTVLQRLDRIEGLLHDMSHVPGDITWTLAQQSNQAASVAANRGGFYLSESPLTKAEVEALPDSAWDNTQNVTGLTRYAYFRIRHAIPNDEARYQLGHSQGPPTRTLISHLNNMGNSAGLVWKYFGAYPVDPIVTGDVASIQLEFATVTENVETRYDGTVTGEFTGEFGDNVLAVEVADEAAYDAISNKRNVLYFEAD